MDKEKVIEGRKAVDKYRQAHQKIYEQPWRKTLPEEHTPLLNLMVKRLAQFGYKTIQEFFDASEELNIAELGFANKQDFESKARPEDRQALARKWK